MVKRSTRPSDRALIRKSPKSDKKKVGRPPQRPEVTNSGETRLKILAASLDLFASKGQEGTSVREIAQKADVNPALISYHFGGKENLYFECLSAYTLQKVESLTSLLVPPKSKEEFLVRFSMFISEAMKQFADSPQFVRMVQREFELNSVNGMKIYKQNLDPMFQMVRSFLKKSQDEKILRSSVKTELLTIMIFALLSHLCHAEMPMKMALGCSIKDEKFLKNYHDAILELITNGALA